MFVVRCPSGSPVKLDAIRGALTMVLPDKEIDLQGLPVELQARHDFAVNAQPEGQEETIGYARERWHEMCRQHGAPVDLDISIESGAIGGLDVAVVALYSARGDEIIILSEGIAFPAGSLDEARRRGFKTTTAGDVIHEQYPHVPSNSWQAHFPPHKSREDQIKGAVLDGLLWLGAH